MDWKVRVGYGMEGTFVEVVLVLLTLATTAGCLVGFVADAAEEAANAALLLLAAGAALWLLLVVLVLVVVVIVVAAESVLGLVEEVHGWYFAWYWCDRGWLWLLVR